MIDKLKKLTDSLIIFSALVSDFEELDFKSDALAGVRANYFNSSKSTQSDKTEVVIDSKAYNLSYLMCNNEPLSWKITRNNRPYQSVKRAAGSVYCVIVYGENGIINKRIYFNDNHEWLKTEFYDKCFENVLLATLSPKIINGVVILRFEQINSNGFKTVEDLFPSSDMPETQCRALVYSNAGMLWFDKRYKPENFDDYEILLENNNVGFNFRSESFNFSNDKKDAFDLSNAEYLDDNYEATDVEINENEEISTDAPYSAYDKIEKILSEAHKSNKDLFGEVINQVVNSSYSEEAVSVPQEDCVLLENKTISEDEINEDTDTIEVNNVIEADVADNEIVIDNCETESEGFADTEDNSEYEISKERHCDVVIHTKTGRYSYYGAIDENNCRSGKGRTVTPDGNTSYEGEYKNDKRDGFGVCYYNEGNINYVGNWTDGNRNGCGVGYRLSDGTMHIGKWDNNTPVGYGARFDSDGNFIDVSAYSDGQKDGKSISVDENGNVVIKKFKNGELISERTIIDED